MLLIAALVAAALAAPTEGPVRLRVGSPQKSKQRTFFSARQILDLHFSASFPPMPGDHLLELRVFAPSGHLYQVLTVPFSNPPRAARRHVEGYPRPLEVQRPATVEADGVLQQSVGAVLPVAGTWVVSSSLYGRWRADAHLDGSPQAVATVGFAIEE